MAERGRSSLTEVAGQPFVAGLDLWVVESSLCWDDRLSSGVHDHCAVPVVGPHCSQQHTLLTDAREAKSVFWVGVAFSFAINKYFDSWLFIT